MKRVGIICEFNPFHNGHRYLLESVRAAGAEEIVCVMSESFVQRCEPCLLPSRERAEAAVLCGADAVFSLPFPWSCASAEYFAGTGMYLLQLLGCDAVAFGSESGDLTFLQAESAKIAGIPQKEEGTASVYGRLPANDILGTAYLRACKRLSWEPEVLPVKRQGLWHREKLTPGNLYRTTENGTAPRVGITSTGARKEIRGGNIPRDLPSASCDILERSLEAGLCPSDLARFDDILFSFWRVAEPETQSQYAECGSGVAERLCGAARRAAKAAEMFPLAATKKYTDARLRRAALFGYLRITEEMLHETPAYTRLLGCNARGRALCGTLPVHPDFAMIANVRNLPRTPAAQAQKSAELRAEALLTMLYPSGNPAGFLFRRPPVIVEGPQNSD